MSQLLDGCGRRARCRLGATLCSVLLALALASAAAEVPAEPAASPSPSGASAAPGLLGDLSLSSSDEPIVVESKELEFDYQKNRVYYRGEVRAKQGDVTIDCDELVVFFDRADDVRNA